MYAVGPACVKTTFKSELRPKLLDFRKFQFAKTLISLKLKFHWLGQDHYLSSSPTFLHSLGQNEKYISLEVMSALRLTIVICGDTLCAVTDNGPNRG